jgi:hypothetical protein
VSASLVAALLCGFGCTSGRLEPAAATDADISRGGVLGSDNGVDVRLLVGNWRGSPEALRYSAPVYVSITNNSGRALEIERSAFGLIAEDGDRYAAMSPTQIVRKIHRYNERLGRLDRLPFEARYAPFAFRPGPEARGLGAPSTPPPGAQRPVTPAPGRAAAAAPSTGLGSSIDYSQRPRELRHRGDRDHFPSDIREMSLTEAVLESGETRAGYVYFEPVAQREDELKFTVRLNDANTGGTVARISIPIYLE